MSVSISTAASPSPSPEPSPAGTDRPVRTAQTRHYLMCPPTFFSVEYAINPWMDPSAPVDRVLAFEQWDALRAAYESLGHRVSLLDPAPGSPDMVFAANGAVVVDGKVLAARFRGEERRAEEPAYRAWFEAAGFRDLRRPMDVTEGEGDFVLTDRFLLAGTGFRTAASSHREAQEFFGRPVVSLELVDPWYYHLDTALVALDGHTIAYYPGAFSPGSVAVLRHLFPDAVIADERDAAVLGLNAVSDGRNVVLAAEAVRLAERLRSLGYEPVPVDISELRKAGGGAKCCTLEVRR